MDSASFAPRKRNGYIDSAAAAPGQG